MIVSRIAISSLVALAGCRGEKRDTATGKRLDLVGSICGVRGSCHQTDRHAPAPIDGNIEMAIFECAGDHASAYGYWGGDEAAVPPPFGWDATVPIGGVFPSRGAFATAVRCIDRDPGSSLAIATVATGLTGLALAPLDGNDVFIPLGGRAALEEDVHARAKLEEPSAGDPRRAVISIDGPKDSQRVYHRGTGDVFPWGHYDATVVRIVEPRDGVLEPIGWVEVKVSVPAKNVDGGAAPPVVREE